MKCTIIIDASTEPKKWCKPRIVNNKYFTGISVGFAIIYIFKLTLTETLDYFEFANKNKEE